MHEHVGRTVDGNYGSPHRKWTTGSKLLTWNAKMAIVYGGIEINRDYCE